MKVALVHDQLAEFGGAERVLLALKKAFPNADIFTAFVDVARMGEHWQHFKDCKIIQSWARCIPFFRKLYSPLRFLAPLIWRSFDFSDYDVVISSSAWYMSKAVASTRPPPLSKKKRPVHICYLHTPPRYLYGYETAGRWQSYFIVKIYALLVNHFLRIWDYKHSQDVDYFIFNSQEVRARSLKFYRRDGEVIHPPIEVPTKHIPNSSRGNYYLTVSRLVYSKHIDIIIHSANALQIPLKIVGTGREEKRLREIAGATVEFMGSVPDRELESLYANAKAFLYASVDEDFGMVPVEAMAHKLPVIAYASGGVMETVKDGKNGFLYPELSVQSLVSHIRIFENMKENELEAMREEAYRFAQTCSVDRFVRQIQSFVLAKTGTSPA
jgi:glycosyltransferase involved in cell wall biosynthesis